MESPDKLLQKKGFDFQESGSIIYDELDIKVRELYNVQKHPIHLWDRYCLGDANEVELIKDAESNTTPPKKYENTEKLFDDMDSDLLRLANLYPEK
jgi:hypothetical protein